MNTTEAFRIINEAADGLREVANNCGPEFRVTMHRRTVELDLAIATLKAHVAARPTTHAEDALADANALLRLAKRTASPQLVYKIRQHLAKS